MRLPFSRQMMMLTLGFGLLLARPIRLPADDSEITNAPVIHYGEVVTIESGAEGKGVALYEGQWLTLKLDKRIQSVSGFDTAFVQVQTVKSDTILFQGGQQSGRTTLKIRDANDTLTEILVTVKDRGTEKLQRALRELFPETKFKLYELGASILIRGTVPTALDSRHISEVASQFYPEVLNHLTVESEIAESRQEAQREALAQRQDGDGREPADSEQQTNLQSDIRALHADVKRLIELLEQRQSSTGRRGKPQAGEDPARGAPLELQFAPPSRSIDRDVRPDAADSKARRGTFSGVVRVTGEVPFLPPAAKADHARNFTDEAIPDESLIVGDGNGLANVFVYLRKAPAGTDADDRAADEPVKLKSREGRLVPHCAIVRVGQDVQLQNLDPVLTNFHTFPLRNSAINMALPLNDLSGPTFVYKRPELLPIKIGDDIHPWKRAYHLVVDHPYAALTDAEGRFQIEGLPPGKYDFCIWHERAGYIDKDFPVTFGDDRSKDIEFLVDVAQLLAQQPSTTKAASPGVAPLKAVPASMKSPMAVDMPPEVARLPSKPLLLYFYADWAEPSRLFKSVVTRFAQLDGVPVAQIDVGKLRSIAMYFRVTELPTLMLIENRKEVGRAVKWADRNDLQRFIGQANQPKYERVWNALGLRLVPLPADAGELAKHNRRYRGGMLVSEVREDFPHPPEDGLRKLRKGDVIVGLGLVETTNIENVIRAIEYDQKTDESRGSSIRFYAVRGGGALDGELRIATTKESDEPSADDADENELGWADGVRDGAELLFFQAGWCVPCQQMVPVMRKFAEDAPVRVRIVDVDKERALAEKYGINSIPALVLVCNGEEVNRKIGMATAEQLREFLRTDTKEVFKFYVGFTR